MKRVYIAILLFAIAICTASAETGYVTAKADNYISKINEIDMQMKKDNFQEAILQCRQLEKSWDKNSKIINVLLMHDHTEDIGDNISKMKSYAENASVDMYFSESIAAKRELTQMKEGEFPTIDNIL